MAKKKTNNTLELPKDLDFGILLFQSTDGKPQSLVIGNADLTQVYRLAIEVTARINADLISDMVMQKSLMMAMRQAQSAEDNGTK